MRVLLLGAGVLSVSLTAWQRSDGQEQPSLPQIRIAADQRLFVRGANEEPFHPWGFNYDHDADGVLLEDYWFEDWPRVEGDFREMRALGANVVRVHLQVARFLDTAESANEAALAQLRRLLELAAREELYLDITGLGCYHAADVPAWYDALDETARWAAQSCFWTAVAKTCAASDAVFCYDLMNEPVVPGLGDVRESWLGPPFAGKCFVQFITRDLNSRQRQDVAREWTQRLVEAIRAHDARHLITVGLVDWSIERPGLTSGFPPEVIAPCVDFLSVHIYPQRDAVSAALDTLRGFQQGKPVLVEETFPLLCSLAEFDQFLDAAAPLTAGFIGFYWGQTREECNAAGTLQGALTAAWLARFQQGLPRKN